MSASIVEQAACVWEGRVGWRCTLFTNDTVALVATRVDAPECVYRTVLDGPRAAHWSQGQWGSVSHTFAVLRRIFASSASQPSAAADPSSTIPYAMSCVYDVCIST